MPKDLIKKPAKGFALETLSNLLYEQLGALWRSALLAGLAALAWRFYADTPPDVRLIVLLFIVAFVFMAVDRSISKRRFSQVSVAAVEDAPLIPDAADIGLGAAQGETTAQHLAESPQPAREDKPEENPAERIFAHVEPAYLVGLFQKQTRAQANRLLTPYVGKWMRVSGLVLDVSSDENGALVHLGGESIRPLIAALFTEQRWIGRVETLRRDDPITIIGKIEGATSLALTLGQCEVVDSSPQTTE